MNNSDKLQEMLEQINTLPNKNSLDTTDANATVNDILLNKTAYVNGQRVMGNIPINEPIAISIAGTSQAKDFIVVEANSPKSYYSGDKIQEFTYQLTSADEPALIPENIKSNISIYGVNGNYYGLDTSDATATNLDILNEKTAYANNEKIIGTIQTYNNETEETDENIIYLIGGKYCANNIEVSAGGMTDMGDATATANYIQSGYTAYTGDGKITGSAAYRTSLNGYVTFSTHSVYSGGGYAYAEFYGNSVTNSFFSSSCSLYYYATHAQIDKAYADYNAAVGTSTAALVASYEEGVNEI